MKLKQPHELFQNRIVRVISLILICILTFQAVSNGTLTSLALEQSSYCGMGEHTHTEDCYLENILVCNQKAHTHSENCYLLLLKDNNINLLLEEMDQTRDKSLVSVMENAVEQALKEMDHDTALTESDHSLVLNEVEGTVMEEEPSEEEPVVDQIVLRPSIGDISTKPEIVPGVLNPVIKPVVPKPTTDQSSTDTAIDKDKVSTDTAIDKEDVSTDSAIEKDENTSTDSAVEMNPTEEEEKEDLLTKLEGTQIGDLNNMLQMGTTLPPIVLNENMVGLNGAAMLETADIVDGSETTANNGVNFYVYFVDEEGNGGWTFIGSEVYERVYDRSWNTYRGIRTETVLALIEDAMPGIDAGTLTLSYYYQLPSNSRTWVKANSFKDNWGEDNIAFDSTGFYGDINNGTYSVFIGASGTSPGAAPSISFCRVTYKYSTQASEIIYYKTGTKIKLPSLAEGYVWKDQSNNTYEGDTSISVGKTYDFEAIAAGCTVTFETNGGSEVTSQIVKEGEFVTKPQEPSREGYLFGGWYSDPAFAVPFDFTAPILSSTTVYANWIAEERTITYLRIDGSIIITETRLYDEVITISELPEGACIWKDNSTMTYYNAGDTLTVQKNYVLQAVAPYTVTLIDTTGEVIFSEETIPGETFVLEAPENGYVWTDDDGHSYDERTELTVNKDLTFRLKEYVTINYAVNWNTTSASNAGITSGSYTVPTVQGGSTSTYVMTQGTTVTLYDVSDTEVTIDFPLAMGSSARPGIAIFQGWKVKNTNTILRPGDVHTYAEMMNYAVDGKVDLTGVWTYTRNLAVNFFIEYNSSGTSSSDASYWTPVLYNTYYAGASANTQHNVEKSKISDQDGDDDVDNYDINAVLRAMTDHSETKYLYSFPTDEEVFKLLENYTAKLSVDGISVTAQELHEHGFTILWTKLGYVSADGNFHMDGLLVRKSGYIYVNKTFSGNTEAIESVKDGDYYISAVSQEDYREERLTLDNYESYDPETQTYTWVIDGVAYGEEWELTERNYTATVDGVTIDPYMEYTISDALGTQSKHDEYTGSITVTGQTYDSTISTDEVLTVSLNNIYQGTDTFILKKEDLDTGNALAGASFALYQNGELLKFNYHDGIYTCAVDGTVTELDCTSGFLEITVNGLDFSQGDIVVRETKTPEGYISLADDVGLSKEGDYIIVKEGNTTASRIQNGVLVIGNTSTTATVTVTKAWTKQSDARDVVINLLANEELVTTLFPELSGISAIVTLDQEGNYSYTWDNLPAYADGSLIQWSVKETRIGDERATDDGSFDNWNVLYSGAKITQNSDGDTVVSMTVTNSRKSGNTFVVHKVSESGKSLSGAQFLLQMLDKNGEVSSDFTAQTGTTDVSGLAAFSGLPFGMYQLTELMPPLGYVGVEEPIRFTVNSDRSITMIEDGGGAATAVSGSMAVRVINYNGRPLPATGGDGSYRYHTLGLMCLLTAACFTILPKRKKKGGME